MRRNLRNLLEYILEQLVDKYAHRWRHRYHIPHPNHAQKSPKMDTVVYPVELDDKDSRLFFKDTKPPPGESLLYVILYNRIKKGVSRGVFTAIWLQTPSSKFAIFPKMLKMERLHGAYVKVSAFCSVRHMY